MPSLTRTLKQLEELSLISRQVDNNDKRSKKLYFTQDGRVVLNSLNEKIADVKQQFYAGLTHEQLDAMACALLQIEQNASDCISLQETRRASKLEEGTNDT